jgi:hypothetical protein
MNLFRRFCERAKTALPNPPSPFDDMGIKALNTWPFTFMIHTSPSKLHWNYFLALERDLEIASRYVEFCEPNYAVYSIEFAHLLFAAASEVDVVAKLLCERLSPNSQRGNIDNYRSILTAALPDVSTTRVTIPRYGLSFSPWENWSNSQNPDWWRSYNNVKHERNAHFQEATLTNAINALGGLLIFTFYYYSYLLATNTGSALPLKLTSQQLQPESTLLRLPESY